MIQDLNVPTVNIITVCFNSENCIKKAIDSVINQTYSNIKYYIIDGNSSDNTLNIVQDYVNKYCNRVFLFSEPDLGIYNAMNKGIKIVNDGESYIYFLNSDDYLSHDKVIEEIINYANGFDFIYGQIRMNDKQRSYLVGKKVDYESLLLNNICHQSVFVKRKIFDLLGFFDESFKIVSDYKFFLSVFLNSAITIKYLNYEVAEMLAGGISNVMTRLHHKERLRVIKCYYNRKLYFKAVVVYLYKDVKNTIKYWLKSITS